MQLFDCKTFCSIKRSEMRRIGTTWKILSLFYAPKKERILTTIKKNWNGNALNLWWYSLRCYCNLTQISRKARRKERKTNMGFDQTKGFQRNINFRIQFEISVYESTQCRARENWTQHETISEEKSTVGFNGWNVNNNCTSCMLREKLFIQIFFCVVIAAAAAAAALATVFSVRVLLVSIPWI